MMNTYNNSISITAQPNPFFETMTIQLVSPTEDTYSFWLYDLTGRMVQSEENILSQSEFEIGSDLLPGIYFLKVQQGISLQTLKIVKK
ncbi:MAG: T9SS type A sorting domain-containing protein [Bacteroidetes bacterium]|nr:T9SS type A sorting domain-containing protein [Bacteroidota bacterium]